MKALSVAVRRAIGAVAATNPWRADQAITVEQGLDLMTRAGAYATFEEDARGASVRASSPTSSS